MGSIGGPYCISYCSSAAVVVVLPPYVADYLARLFPASGALEDGSKHKERREGDDPERLFGDTGYLSALPVLAPSVMLHN